MSYRVFKDVISYDRSSMCHGVIKIYSKFIVNSGLNIPVSIVYLYSNFVEKFLNISFINGKNLSIYSFVSKQFAHKPLSGETWKEITQKRPVWFLAGWLSAR